MASDLFHEERIMWAELRNGLTRFLVASGDWDNVTLLCGRHCWIAADVRWDEANKSWRWTEAEARQLADQLQSYEPACCEGRARIDLAGKYASGSRIETIDDGLSSRERTATLISFLRSGGFAWRYIVEA